MSTVSASTLRSYATQLRELARTHRSNAAACGSLLDAITKLDTSATWSGTYPDAAHTQFAAWVAGLTSTVDELLGEAASWCSWADDFDRRAVTAPK